MSITRASAARNKYANVCRHHPDDEEMVTDHRRNLAAAKIEDYVEKIVGAAPPLSAEQIERISALLRSDGAA